MIEAKSLVKRFGAVTALDSISCTVEESSIFGLVGSNGAGKSTFLRTLAGIYQPDGGSVFIFGKEPFENSSVKEKLFFISDYPYFLPQATLKNMASFYAGLYSNWSKERFEEMCRLFPLNTSAKIVNMSKGMQRQAALICAMAAQPKLLLLDEIFDGLDPVMRQLLKRIISREVADRQMTVIIASHNLRELEDFCDHVGLFHRGGVVFDKDLDELKLGICRVQAAFRPLPEQAAFAGLDIVKQETHGSLVNFVVRGNQEKILEQINSLQPVFVELLPLTLEEVFISEMEAAGYDIDNILN